MYGENQLKWDNVSDFVAVTAATNQYKFEPVQETNLFLLTLATFTATVQKGLKAFPLYDCKTWTLVDQKKKKKKKLQRMILFRVVILNKLHPSLV